MTSFLGSGSDFSSSDFSCKRNGLTVGYILSGLRMRPRVSKSNLFSRGFRCHRSSLQPRPKLNGKSPALGENPQSTGVRRAGAEEEETTIGGLNAGDRVNNFTAPGHLSSALSLET